MIRGCKLHHKLAYIVGIGIRALHQLLYPSEKHIGVKVYRMADIDKVVRGLFQSLFRHELLLIELFAGAQPGILYFYIHIGAETGELDEVARKRVDLHRRAHIQHEYLPAAGIRPRLEHKADRLRHCHEIADDVRVRDGDGTALGDLLFEKRHDRAVAAQHVAEAHSHKLRAHIARRAVLRARGVNAQARDAPCLARLYAPVKALHHHLAQALGRAHDVGGVDRLVRRDEHKAPAPVRHGGIRGLICAEDVVFYRLAGAVLHERDMLVRRRVEHQLRPVLCEHLL